MKLIQKYTLFIYIFSINFELWDPFNTGIDFFLTKVSALLYIFSTLPEFILFFSIKNYKKFLVPIFIFFGILTYMNYINQSKGYSVYFNIPFFLNLIIMLVSLNHSRIENKLLLKCLFVFSISLVVFTVMYMFGIQTDSSFEDRITVLNNNQNELGLKLAISILVLLVIVRENRLNLNRFRYLFYLIIPIMFIFMVKTGSRVAFISLILGLITYFLLQGKNITINKILKIVPIFVIALIIWQFILKNSVLLSRLFSTVNEGDLSGRDIRWLASIDLISKNQLFGQGETGYSKNIEPLLGFYSSPHNVFIEILCYTGVVGLIIFSIFLLRVIVSAAKSYYYKNELLPLVLLFPIFGMILSGQIIGTKIAWIIFTYIIAFSMSNNYKKNSIRKHNHLKSNNSLIYLNKLKKQNQKIF